MAQAPAPAAPPKMITGLFRDAVTAEQACDIVIERGYQASDINVVMSDATRAKDFAKTPAAASPDHSSAKAQSAGKPIDGTKAGGPIGATIGTIAPAVAAAGTLLLIPGLVFAGPVTVALAAAGAVGVAGGLIGALATWGVPKKRVEEYEASIRDGGILLGVKPHSVEDARYIQQRWQASGGELVHS